MEHNVQLKFMIQSDGLTSTSCCMFKQNSLQLNFGNILQEPGRSLLAWGLHPAGLL